MEAPIQCSSRRMYQHQEATPGTTAMTTWCRSSPSLQLETSTVLQRTGDTRMMNSLLQTSRISTYLIAAASQSLAAVPSVMLTAHALTVQIRPAPAQSYTQPLHEGVTDAPPTSTSAIGLGLELGLGLPLFVALVVIIFLIVYILYHKMSKPKSGRASQSVEMTDIRS